MLDITYIITCYTLIVTIQDDIGLKPPSSWIPQQMMMINFSVEAKNGQNHICRNLSFLYNLCKLSCVWPGGWSGRVTQLGVLLSPPLALCMNHPYTVQGPRRDWVPLSEYLAVFRLHTLGCCVGYNATKKQNKQNLCPKGL